MEINNLLANLGFLLQFSGFFIFLVALFAIYLNEINESIAFFITASIFFIVGFPMNALSERKDLNFRESLILFFLSFFFLGMIGSIPYLYLNLFDSSSAFEKIINSIFEGVSGFTTTGISLLKNIEFSASMIIYRSTTQFIGGIGIIYLLLTFLYSSNYNFLRVFSKFFLCSTSSEIKKNVTEILIFFCISTICLSLLMYYFNKNIIKSFSLVMSGISTGGFSHYDIKSLSLEEKIIIIISMILGSISIFVIPKFKIEFPIYLLMILFVFLVFYLNKVSLFDSIFHAISLVSTTGYSYLDFESLPQNVLITLSIIMLIGGMAISTSGGMKILRFVNSKLFIWKIIRSYINEEIIEINSDNLISLAYLFLFISMWILLTLIFSNYYSTNNISKNFFDVASILSTSGFSINISKHEPPLELKIILIFSMILARIEILPFFAIFIFRKKENRKRLHKIISFE